MDSITHIASGALIGEAFLGKTLGKRAMLIGAVAQSLPDIDFVASFWLNPTDDLLAHRGITHSILFGTIASIILGLIAHRTHQGFTVSRLKWVAFFMLEIGTHLFLDAFNNYGVGWFEPFNDTRISFNTIFVFDPFYSVWLTIAFIALLLLSRASNRRLTWVIFGLSISSVYLLYGLYHKYEIDGIIQQNIINQHLSGKKYFSTPTVLNNWLWYVVVEDSSDFLVGYHSVFDHSDTIAFHRFSQNKGLLKPYARQKDVRKLRTFAQGYFTVDNLRDTIVFNDLRFGQIAGWSNANAPFVFHYYINRPDANALVVQRGRFEGWNSRTFADLLDRIRGQ